MTRKDYKAFADIFQNYIAGINGQDDKMHEYLTHLINDFCILFAKDNPTFNKHRFLVACGLELI